MEKNLRQLEGVLWELNKAGHDFKGHAALKSVLDEKIEFQKPSAQTRVELYDYLNQLGLQDESPLFGFLFEKFATNLPIK